jgi:sugar phosphate isomerase/epimerase
MAIRLGCCSWSLRPDSPVDLAAKVSKVGVSAVQLALDPLRTERWSLDETVSTLSAAGIEIRSGMMTTQGEDYSTLETIRQTGGVRLDEHWDANLTAADANARVAATLGLELVTFHAGFIPHDPADQLHSVMIERLRAVVDGFAARGVKVAFETGQETAETLAAALDQLDRPEVGVNFDPANMILYGMGDPVDALRRLAPRVRQIHLKDALPAAKPGTWGKEVPVGSGAVDWPAFFRETKAARLAGDLMIEREAGESRIPDMRRARDLVTRLATLAELDLS